jgi:hypothetical protein
MKTWLTRRSLCYASTHSWLVGKCAKNGCSGTVDHLLCKSLGTSGLTGSSEGKHLVLILRDFMICGWRYSPRVDGAFPEDVYGRRAIEADEVERVRGFEHFAPTRLLPGCRAGQGDGAA